ncbi:MAG: hypothetical protein AB7P02_12545 [Alphaproteobacteria bacterium]
MEEFYVARIASLPEDWRRLDGKRTGGNRDRFGGFRMLGRQWRVNSDTHIDLLSRAYEALRDHRPEDVFVEETTRGGDTCLNLAPPLRDPGRPKHFYVYLERSRR